jgi:four helix bundle protein
MRAAKTHRDLDVYESAVTAALAASALTRAFPHDEHALKDQLRRAGRAPGACLAEAWRKRRYKSYWTNKLSDALGEAGEAEYWLEIAWREGYCTREQFEEVFDRFEKLSAQLIKMITNPAAWTTR